MGGSFTPFFWMNLLVRIKLGYAPNFSILGDREVELLGGGYLKCGGGSGKKNLYTENKVNPAFLWMDLD